LGLWKAALGSFGDQLWRADFGNNFGEQLCEQLEKLRGIAMRRAAFDDAFSEQFSGRTFGNPLWEGSNSGEHLVIYKETRTSDWYRRPFIFIFFSFWVVCLSARLELFFFLFILKSYILFYNALYSYNIFIFTSIIYFNNF
jgi:hypothetical protein